MRSITHERALFLLSSVSGGDGEFTEAVAQACRVHEIIGLCPNMWAMYKLVVWSKIHHLLCLSLFAGEVVTAAYTLF